MGFLLEQRLLGKKQPVQQVQCGSWAQQLQDSAPTKANLLPHESVRTNKHRDVLCPLQPVSEAGISIAGCVVGMELVAVFQ
jgi:hypothetical protein